MVVSVAKEAEPSVRIRIRGRDETRSIAEHYVLEQVGALRR